MSDAPDFSLDAMHTDVIAHQRRTLESVGAKPATRPLVPWHEVGWEARGQAFGASELGALLDVSPYEDRLSLVHRKATGERTPSKPAMVLGSCLEDGILRFYAEMTGRKVTPWTARRTIASVAFPHLVVTPDAVDDSGDVLLEIKHSAGGRGWGVGAVIDECDGYTTHEGSAAPLHYQVQVQGQMAVTGHKHCRIAGLIRGRLRIYEVPRHAGVIERIRRECVSGWAEVLRLREQAALKEG
jgi:predicted phage-related endonuclease